MRIAAKSRSLRSRQKRWLNHFHSPATSLVDDQHASVDFDPSSAVVYENVCSEEQVHSLIHDISIRMSRRRVEKGHWDAVISDYKEVELMEDASLKDVSRGALHVCRTLLKEHHLSRDDIFLPCHAILLEPQGELRPHVDSVRFSGGLVAGLSLRSSSIMRLQDYGGGHWIDLHLPPNSLYALTGKSRFQYTHELLSGTQVFQPTKLATPVSVTRDTRLSIIFRDAKAKEEQQ